MIDPHDHKTVTNHDISQLKTDFLELVKKEKIQSILKNDKNERIMIFIIRSDQIQTSKI